MNDMHPIQMFFSSHHPLASKVNATFEGSEGGIVFVQIQGADGLVYDGKTNRVHSGFATIVLDSIMGGAVMGSLEQLMPIATIGLSMHHMRRAIAGEKITGKAECTQIYKDVAYVTGELTGENGDPLAIASGTFMIGTRATSIRSKAENDKKTESRI